MSDHSRRYSAEHWDHERDLRKHDFPTIARLEPEISPAQHVAILVKNTSNIQHAADLIEAYARDRAAARVLDITVAALESPLSRREPTDAQ
jgi:hypothetical protein